MDLSSWPHEYFEVVSESEVDGFLGVRFIRKQRLLQTFINSDSPVVLWRTVLNLSMDSVKPFMFCKTYYDLLTFPCYLKQRLANCDPTGPTGWQLVLVWLVRQEWCLQF
jgi:hypothetical protein